MSQEPCNECAVNKIWSEMWHDAYENVRHVNESIYGEYIKIRDQLTAARKEVEEHKEYSQTITLELAKARAERDRLQALVDEISSSIILIQHDDFTTGSLHITDVDFLKIIVEARSKK